MGGASRSVAGTAGNLLPCIFIHFVEIILDRKVLAAHRAAQRHCASADAEFDSLAADLALHNTLNNLSP